MSRLIVVLDANVVYGITPTDLLITLAVRDAYRPHWSEAILDEAVRNLTTNRPDLDPNKITQRFVLMNRALDGANTPAPPTALVDEMTNDVNDRHVLATAITVGADVIVTENLRHFPPSACAPHGIIAMSLHLLPPRRRFGVPGGPRTESLMAADTTTRLRARSRPVAPKVRLSLTPIGNRESTDATARSYF